MNDSISMLNTLIHSLIALELLPATTPTELWNQINSPKEQVQNVCKYEPDGNSVYYSRATGSIAICTPGDANTPAKDSH